MAAFRTVMFPEIYSRKGNWYFYDAISNKLFTGDGHSFRMPLHIKEKNSPVQQIKLPYSLAELRRELESRLSHLVLNVTEQCNLRCDYCSYNGQHQFRRNHSTAQMSAYTAKTALDWFATHCGESPEITVSFYGGEPFMNRELIKTTVEYAKLLFHDRKTRFLITTNGLLLDSDILSWLSVNPEVLVNVTLNGPAELHDRFRHTADGQGSQLRIMENLKEIKHNDPAVFDRQIGIIVNYLTGANLLTIGQWYANEPVLKQKMPVAFRRIVLRFADELLRNWFNQYIPDQDTVLTALERIEAEYINHLKQKTYQQNLWGLLWDAPLAQIHFRNRIPLGPVHYFAGSCAPLIQRTFIDVDGNIRLCEKGDGKVILGHIHDGIDYNKLEHLLVGFEELLNQRCRFCFAIRRCGLCLNDVLDSQGIDSRLQKPRCRDFISGFQHELSLYCSIMEEGEELLDHLYPPGIHPSGKLLS